MYPAQQQQQGTDTGTTDDSRSKFSVCTGTTSAPSRPRVRTCGVVYRRLEMRTRPRRVQMPIPPGIGTSVLLPLLRVPSCAGCCYLPLIWHYSQRRPTRTTDRRASIRPKSSPRTSSKTPILPCPAYLLSTDLRPGRRGASSAVGKQATIGSSVTAADLGPSCHSRSRTRTRALDPMSAVPVVEIECPAHPQGRGRHDGPSRQKSRSVPVPPGSGSATSCIG